jgi:hypothetical protein
MKIGEFEALFKVTTVERDYRDRWQIILAPTNATGMLHAISAIEILRKIGRGRGRTYRAMIRAQTPSYGGMEEPRHRQGPRRRQDEKAEDSDPGCGCCSCQ